MKIVYPNYNNCLVNLSNSILKYADVKTNHSTLKEIDDILNEKEYKNVIIMLFDGMGSNILEKHFKDSFILRNKIRDIASVFPSTTTAATTSIKTGLTPSEHCWLGWNNYIQDINEVVTMYLNVKKGTNEQIDDYNVCKKYFPYNNIIDIINEKSKIKAYYLSPFEGTNYENDHDMYKKIVKLCEEDQKKFIYVYNTEPDHLMHEFGVESISVTKKLRKINNDINRLSKKLQDTLLIVTADHGHITAGDYIVLSDYKDLNKMLLRGTSIESRATNFFVKSEYVEKFKEEFNKLFKKDFILLSKKEILNKKIFGDGLENKLFSTCIGDYMAISISNKSIVDVKEDTTLKGLHAGLTEDEMMVPLIVIKK